MSYVAFSLREAARLTGLHFMTIQNLTQTLGVGQKVDGRWCFTSDDLRRIKTERRQAGRPAGWRKYPATDNHR